jgi:hypothetical protein
MSIFLSGCVSKFIENNNLRQPLDGNTVLPWVKVGFFVNGENNTKKRGAEITVGNDSAKSLNNTAVIKSFEYGSSNGAQCTLEILDEQGSTFHLFINKIATDIAKISGTLSMMVQWGWVKQTCDGNPQFEGENSPILQFIPTHMDVKYEGTKIRFFIVGQDIFQPIFASRSQIVIGDDELAPTEIKDAIGKLFSEREPKVPQNKIRYLRHDDKGELDREKEWEFDKKTPTGTWHAENRNKLSAAMSWLEGYSTDAQKGFYPCWDAETQELLFLEDPRTGETESEKKLPDSFPSLGTFVVGGGGASRVLSFTPKINWISSFATGGVGGGTGGTASAKTVQKKGKDDQDDGLSQNIPIADHQVGTYGPKGVSEGVSDSVDKNTSINAFFSQNTQGLIGLTAELKVQGVPNREFVIVYQAMMKRVSVVVIGPFRLGGTGCGEFLADSTCNAVLSSKNWVCMAVHHSIREGSYVTTLELMLPKPDFMAERTEPRDAET